jgi:hypothetical protein
MCTVDQAGAAQLLRIGRRFISPMGPSHPVILPRHSRSAQSRRYLREVVVGQRVRSRRTRMAIMRPAAAFRAFAGLGKQCAAWYETGPRVGRR